MAQQEQPKRRFRLKNQSQVKRQEEQEKTPAPSKARRLGAGALRVGSSLAATPFSLVPGPGNLIAAGIGGAGELGAEAIEGSPLSLRRAGVEAILAAIPASIIFKGGKIAHSALRTGAMTGVGEGMRQAARGEDIDLGGIGLAAGLGAATGGLIGKFTPLGKGVPAPPPAPKAAVPTGKARLIKRDPLTGQETAKEIDVPTEPIYASIVKKPSVKKAESQKDLIKTPAKAPEVSANDAVKLYETRGERSIGKAMSARNSKDRAMQTAGEKVTRANEKQLAAQEKVGLGTLALRSKTEAKQEVLKKIEDEIKAGKLTPGQSKVSQSMGAGGTRMARAFKRPKKKDDGDDLLDDLLDDDLTPSRPPKGPDSPTPGSGVAAAVPVSQPGTNAPVVQEGPHGLPLNWKAMMRAKGKELRLPARKVQETIKEAESYFPKVGEGPRAANDVRGFLGLPLRNLDDVAEAAPAMAAKASQEAVGAIPVAGKGPEVPPVSKAAVEPPNVSPAPGSARAAMDQIDTQVDSLVRQKYPSALYAELSALKQKEQIARNAASKATQAGDTAEATRQTALAKSFAKDRSATTDRAVANQVLDPEVRAAVESKIRDLKRGVKPAAAGAAKASPNAIEEAAMRTQLKDSGVPSERLDEAMQQWKAGIPSRELVGTFGTKAPLPVEDVEAALAAGKANRQGPPPATPQPPVPISQMSTKKQKAAKQAVRRMADKEIDKKLLEAGVPQDRLIAARAIFKGGEKAAATGNIPKILEMLGLPPMTQPATGLPGGVTNKLKEAGLRIQAVRKQEQDRAATAVSSLQPGTVKPGSYASAELAQKAAEKGDRVMERTPGTWVLVSPSKPAPTVPPGGVQQAVQETSGAGPVLRAPELPVAPLDAPAPSTATQKLTPEELKPRLVKPVKKEGSGGTTLGAGFGAFQALPELMQKYPGFAPRLILGGSGAAAGALMNPDDPLVGALIGAGAGAALPSIVNGLRALGVSGNDIPELPYTPPEKLREWVPIIGRIIPDYVRFSYLTSIKGLPANAVVGPWGAAFFGALTKALAGDQRGGAALKVLWNPVNVLREMQKAGPEAIELVNRAEAGDALIRAEITPDALQQLPAAMRNTIRFPAYKMTQGDIGVRNILKNVGFSEDEAREITLTAEPFLPIMQGLVNMRRNSAFAHTLLPFVRTPANIAEQGAARIPVFGFAVQKWREKEGAQAIGTQEQIWQQVIGGLMFVAGYATGANMDPSSASIWRRYISNAAGQYSLLASIGFAAGQSVKRGSDTAFSNELGQAFPLPTTEPITDLYDAVSKVARGEEWKAPRTIKPAIWSEIENFANPSEQNIALPKSMTSPNRRFRFRGQ